jgi:GDP-L-fucose synthase
MSDFWNQKQVIVTGAMGMVGSRLCEFLHGEGARVFGLDDQSRGTYRVPGCAYDVIDCGDYAEWLRVFNYRRLEPFAIFNLAAAVGGVYYNMSAHYSQFMDNMTLQAVPARVAAFKEVPVFLQTSSVCIYDDAFNSPAQEDFGKAGRPEPANAGYAWAKRMGEEVAQWALEGTATRYVIVRPTNMYGIRDYFDQRAHVIPALIKKFLTQDKPTVYGGNQTREFLYADDGARGMMTVAEHGICGEAYNLGTSGETQVTIGRLAEMIYVLTGSGADVVFDHEAETGDAGRCTDSSKAQALGWRHRVSLEEGLGRVIEWYRKEKHGTG